MKRKGREKVFGVVKGIFSYRYEENGCVFGVRFKPGAAYPLVHMPMAQFTNHLDWSQLALDLGYCDQAHFSRAFKAVLGKAPAEYAKTVGADSSAASQSSFTKWMKDDWEAAKPHPPISQ